MNRMMKWMDSSNGQMIVAGILFVLALLVVGLTNCGGSGSNPPVYSDNGICVANCPTDNGGDVNGTDTDANGNTDGKDGFKSELADNGGGDQFQVDGSTDETDGSTDEETQAYVCPSEIPPLEQQEACMPKTAKEAVCSLNPEKKKQCFGGFHDGEMCETQEFCQQVPKDQWPPCVCWQFCGYAGEWDCLGTKANIDLVDNKDGTCLIGKFYFGKPDDPPPRHPLTDDPECYMELNETGDQIETYCKGMNSYTCFKQE